MVTKVEAEYLSPKAPLILDAVMLLGCFHFSHAEFSRCVAGNVALIVTDSEYSVMLERGTGNPQLPRRDVERRM